MKKITFVFGLLLITAGILYFYLSMPYRFVLEGKANLKSGKVAKAVGLLEGAVRKYPDNNEIIYTLAKGYYLLGETDKASKLILDKKLLHSLRDSEDFCNFIVDLAEVNRHAGNFKYAERFGGFCLDSCDEKKISKKLIENYIRIGNILPDKALSLWEKGYVLASRLRNSELKETLKGLLIPKYLNIAGTLRKEKKYSDALEILNKASKYGENAEISFQKGVLYNKIGDLENAEKELEEAIQLNHENDDYRNVYARILSEAASKTLDNNKKNEYYEKIKLLYAGDKNNPAKAGLLRKLINLNARYNVTNTNLKTALVGDFVYPSFSFKTRPIDEHLLKKYKIVFLDKDKSQIDIYESIFTESDINQLIEVTSMNPVTGDGFISAKLFLNDELVKEVITKY